MERSATETRAVTQEQITALEGLVHSIAYKVRASFHIPLDKDDLFQMGMVGLCEAAERYDPESGVALSTYAYTRIRGSILDGIGRMTGLKRSQVRRAKRLAAANEAVASLDHSAEAANPAAYVTGAVDGVLFSADLAELVEDRTAADEDGDSPLASTPERSAGRRELRALVLAVLDELPEDEATLLRAHYVEGRTLADIGAERGVSRSWASRVHTRALRRAQSILREVHGLEAADLSEANWTGR